MKKQVVKQASKEVRIQMTPKNTNSFLRPKEGVNVTPILSSMLNNSTQKTFLRQVPAPQVAQFNSPSFQGAAMTFGIGSANSNSSIAPFMQASTANITSSGPGSASESKVSNTSYSN